MKTNKGISLITLVITIIVIIILAGAVILSLSGNNPIESAKEATFKSNVANYNSELATWLANEYAENMGQFDITQVNATKDTDYEGQKLKDIIPSMKEEDLEKFAIEAGKLVYKGTDEKEKEWTEVSGSTTVVVAVAEGESGTPVTANTTINGGTATYSNPIIPAGFYPVNTTDASWNSTDGWNNGLVIKDASENEYVWVPVKTSSDFKKTDWNKGTSVSSLSADDYTGLDAFDTSVATYGGYYVARYEASKNGSKAASKKGQTVWNNVTYSAAKTASENVASDYGYSTVVSCLITGKAWDTMLTWIESAGYSVTDSTAWGNHSNSTGGGSLKTTGSSETWKAKNIYDVAGNVWEWTTEVYSEGRVNRGGHCGSNGSFRPAAYRCGNSASFSDGGIGFRFVLYIL